MDPSAQIPKIFVAAFASRGSERLDCQALAEDGEGLAQCAGPNLEAAMEEIGYTSDRNHDVYSAHYPHGYSIEWVSDPPSHPGWQSALKRNRDKA